MDEDKIKESEMTEKLDWLEGIDEITIAGETLIEDDVISQIVGIASKQVEGVASMGKASVTKSIMKTLRREEPKAAGVDTIHGKKEAIVDLSINIVYGHNIPRLVIAVRKNVTAALFDICGLVAKEVNVNITGVDYPKRMIGNLD